MATVLYGAQHRETASRVPELTRQGQQTHYCSMRGSEATALAENAEITHNDPMNCASINPIRPVVLDRVFIQLRYTSQNQGRALDKIGAYDRDHGNRRISATIEA